MPSSRELKDLSESLLPRTAAAEMESVAFPLDPVKRLAVVDFYRRLGVPDAVDAELRRMSSSGLASDPLVQAALIENFFERRQDSRALALAAAVRQSIKNPPDELRLSLARAQTAGGEAGEAAKHHAVLLRSRHLLQKALPHLARFVMAQPTVEPLASELLSLAPTLDEASPPLLRYAATRAACEAGGRLARCLIGSAPVEEIDLVEIVLDIGIQAFRLGQWAVSVAAGQRVLSLQPDNESAPRMLVSAYTFGGKREAAIKEFCRLGDPRGLRLSSEQLEAVRRFTGDRSGEQTNYGLVPEIPTGKTHAAVIPKTLEELSEIPLDEPGDTPGTFSLSVTRLRWKSRGPWETLSEIDPRLPHLMIQRARGTRVLHGFIAASGRDRWGWHEVPVLIPEGEQGFLVPLRRILTQPQREQEQDVRATRKLWDQVERELASPKLYPEKGDDD